MNGNSPTFIAKVGKFDVKLMAFGKGLLALSLFSDSTKLWKHEENASSGSFLGRIKEARWESWEERMGVAIVFLEMYLQITLELSKTPTVPWNSLVLSNIEKLEGSK